MALRRASVAAWSGVAATLRNASSERGATVHSPGSGLTRSVAAGAVPCGASGPVPADTVAGSDDASGVLGVRGGAEIGASRSAIRVAWAAIVARALASSSQLHVLPVLDGVTVNGVTGVTGVT